MRSAGSSLVIRKIEPADIPRLDQIRRAAFAPVFASFRALAGPEVAPVALADEEEGQRRHFEKMCAGSERDQVYVALWQGDIAGFVTVMLDRRRTIGEIGLNAVDPKFDNQGIGTAMYLFALDRMREEGMKVAMVGTGADESHAPARAAYAKAGFDRAIPGVHFYRKL